MLGEEVQGSYTCIYLNMFESFQCAFMFFLHEKSTGSLFEITCFKMIVLL